MARGGSSPLRRIRKAPRTAGLSFVLPAMAGRGGRHENRRENAHSVLRRWPRSQPLDALGTAAQKLFQEVGRRPCSTVVTETCLSWHWTSIQRRRGRSPERRARASERD